MEDEQFSAEDSLLLIRSMIDKAKTAVADDSFYFLLWGWLVFIANIIQFVMKVILHSPYHYLAWTLMFVGLAASIWYGITQHNNRKVKTYVEELIGYLWISIFVSYVLFGFLFARIGWANCASFYMLLYSIGNFVSGKALKFPPLVWGAFACWGLSILAAFTPFDTNILLGALAILLSNIIPGFLLKQKYRKMQADVQRS